MLRILLALFGLWAIGSCAHAAAPAVVDQYTNVWVDANARDEGDGSASHPWKAIPNPIPPKVRLHLKSGMYRGPFRAGEDVEVLGQGEVVLFAEKNEGSVLQMGRGHVAHVSIQGGRTGMLVGGFAEIEEVTFSGQLQISLEVASGATLHANRLVFKGLFPDMYGVVIGTHAQATISQTTFEGSYRRAFDVVGAQVRLNQIQTLGVAEGIRARESEVEIVDSQFLNGRESAIRSSAGKLNVHQVNVVGFEYALLASSQVHVTVDGFESKRALLAAVSVVNANAQLRRVHISQSGNFGAIQATNSQLDVDGVDIEDATSMGIVVRKSEITFANVRVSHVKQEIDRTGPSGGDGLHFRDVQGTLQRIELEDLDGAGLWASARSKLTATQLSCRRCAVAGIVVELESQVTATNLSFFDLKVPVISILDKANIIARDWTAESCTQPLIWIDCRKGSTAEFHGYHPIVEEVSCVLQK